MPRKPSDSVIEYRITLGNWERERLGMLAGSKTFNNVAGCPSQTHLFEERVVRGQGSPEAVPGINIDWVEVLPTGDARSLVSYLLSLRKDDAVPYSINYSREKKKAE